MGSRQLLIFRIVLFETLLLGGLYTPGAEARPRLIWGVLGLYAACTSAVYGLRRRGRLPEAAALWSFLIDIAATTAVLYLNQGSSEFYIAYFLVVVMSCLLQNVRYSFIVGGLASLVYGAASFPGFHAEGAQSYLLRVSLLLTTAFFSATIADATRRARQEAAQAYEGRLAWMERLSMAGKTVSALIHEIKTPLNTILLSAEYLKALSRKQGPKEGPADPQFDIIIEESERAGALLSDFLDFTRPSDLTLKPLALAPIARRAFEKVTFGLEPDVIVFEDGLEPGLTVAGSERHLTQVFMNLFGNAVDAMPLGGTLRVSQRRRAEGVEIAVSDTGLGVDPKVLPRLFEPFSTSRESDGGHGLGLSITRWIIEKHGGEIRIESPGLKLGTTVTILFPLPPPAH